MTDSETKPVRKKGLTVEAKAAAAPEPKKAPKRKRKKVVKAKPKPAPKTKAKTAPKRKPKPKPKKVAKRKAPRSRSAADWNYDFGDDEVLADFAKNLSEARAAAGYSQRSLAPVINYSRIAIVNMEGGKNGASLPTLLRLCSALGVTPNDLLRKR